MAVGKYAAALGLFLFCCQGVGAFDLEYGTLFRVSGIALKQNRPVLPLTRGKYANVRVLDKATFETLKACPSLCRQEKGEGELQIRSFRAAKTRAGMWIADVAVDQKWLLTFLVFQKEGQFSFVVPQAVTVLDPNWLSRVEQLLRAQVPVEK